MMEDRDLLLELGATLRAIRRERRMTQAELHRITGMHQNYIGAIERGETNPSVQRINRLSTALGVNIEEVFRRATRRADS